MILHVWHPSDCEARSRRKFIVKDVVAFDVLASGCREYKVRVRGDVVTCAFSPSDKFQLFDDIGNLLRKDNGASWAVNSGRAD